MNITLMAHDKKKELMVQFCTAYKSILSKHSLSATAATGRLVSEATGLPVTLFLSKSQGGHQQIDARIAYNEIDLVFMFSDPNDTDPWEDQRIMRTLRLCDTYNVPCATNLASADVLPGFAAKAFQQSGFLSAQARVRYCFRVIAGHRIDFLFFIIIRQSRSPRCSPRISISAEAKLVAQGTLYVSHRRSVRMMR